MNKTQINKAAKNLASTLEWYEPTTTFVSLRQQADDAYGTDQGKILDAAVAMLEAREYASRSAYIKLLKDLETIDRTLYDGCVASENMKPGVKEGGAFFWNNYFHAACGVVACSAEDKGLDINARLGYKIY